MIDPILIILRYAEEDKPRECIFEPASTSSYTENTPQDITKKIHQVTALQYPRLRKTKYIGIRMAPTKQANASVLAMIILSIIHRVFIIIAERRAQPPVGQPSKIKNGRYLSLAANCGTVNGRMKRLVRPHSCKHRMYAKPSPTISPDRLCKCAIAWHIMHRSQKPQTNDHGESR